MELYLLRHGIAEDAGPGMRDEDRKLTSKGKSKLRETLKLAASAGVKPSLILTSPLVRAVETAEIAANELRYTDETVKTKALIPGASPQEVWQEIRLHKDAAQLLLASHNPLCSYLTGYLLGCRELSVEFKKGALLRVDISAFGPEPKGTLQWMLTPKLASA